MNSYRVLEVGRPAVNHLIMAHYLHSWPGVVVATLALMEGSLPIGVVVFALPPRETQKRYGVSEVWELARLFIIDETPKNTETWFMARCIRWIQKNRPSVELLVSYADPSHNHQGTIYKAGNWIADGKTDQERKTPRFDYTAEVNVEESLFAAAQSSTIKYSRRSHVPDGTQTDRLPRSSKFRYIYWLDGKHEQRRSGARFKVS